MKTIKLPCHGFEIELSDDGSCGSVKSDLSTNDSAANYLFLDEYHFYVDAVESMVLAHACAGIDIESFAYVEGIETTIEALANKI